MIPKIPAVMMMFSIMEATATVGVRTMALRVMMITMMRKKQRRLQLYHKNIFRNS
jgi:hypothetical protein